MQEVISNLKIPGGFLRHHLDGRGGGGDTEEGKEAGVRPQYTL